MNRDTHTAATPCCVIVILSVLFAGPLPQAAAAGMVSALRCLVLRHPRWVNLAFPQELPGSKVAVGRH